MNKKNITKWELRLGVWQVVAMIGVVTGCMTFAFCLGFFSGRSVGFETASASNIASAAKMPIEVQGSTDGGVSDAAEKAVSDVYAKLSERSVAPEKGAAELGAPVDVPAVGAIRESEAPLSPVPSEQVKAVEPPAQVAALVEKNEIGAVWDAKPSVAELEDASQKSAAAGQEQVEGRGAIAPESRDATSGATEGNQILSPEQRAALGATAPADSTTPPDRESARVVSEVAERKKGLGSETSVTKSMPVEEKAVAQPVKVKEDKKVEMAKKGETPPKATPAALAVVKSGPVPKGWYAQVAAPKMKQDADRIAAQLKNSGFGVVIESAQVRGEQYYRILVGPEGGRRQAEVLIDQLKRDKAVQGDPFIRMVK